MFKEKTTVISYILLGTTLLASAFFVPETYAATRVSDTGTIFYTVEKDDTIASIAAQLGVSQAHLRKNNGLQKNQMLFIGDTLIIPTEVGAAIQLGQSMTLQAIATKFGIPVQDIIDSNDYTNKDESSLISPTTEIFIPRNPAEVKKLLYQATILTGPAGGQKIDISAISQQVANVYLGTIFEKGFGLTDLPYNKGTLISKYFQLGRGAFGFVAGQCTDYAASRRPDLFTDGKGFRGNAKDWAINAQKAGYAIGATPRKNAIAVFAPNRGGDPVYGHVAYVEKVDLKNNKIQIIEMNYLGRNIVTRRIIDSHLAVAYIY